MKYFIELSRYSDHKRMLVNRSAIAAIVEDNRYTQIWFVGDEEPTSVNETYDEIIEKLKAE